MSGVAAPRLHCLLARDTRDAVVLRRGPSKRTAVFHWDRATDTFTLGQWLQGRIYERRCDLSRDGRHWIYFAMNGQWTSESLGSWTAVARCGWLKALSFYPKGDGWEGGGLFLEDGRYWVNDRYFDARKPGSREAPAPAPRRDPKAKPAFQINAECLTPYYNRLIRDGWTTDWRTETLPPPEMPETTTRRKPWWYRDWITGMFPETRLRFERRIPGAGTLVKWAHAGPSRDGHGVYWDAHRIEIAGGEALDLPDAGWADVDGGRVVWASRGKLLAASAPWTDRRGRLLPMELHDFAPYAFEARVAPY